MKKKKKIPTKFKQKPQTVKAKRKMEKRKRKKKPSHHKQPTPNSLLKYNRLFKEMKLAAETGEQDKEADDIKITEPQDTCADAGLTLYKVPSVRRGARAGMAPI